jgi:hypothetical protein
MIEGNALYAAETRGGQEAPVSRVPAPLLQRTRAGENIRDLNETKSLAPEKNPAGFSAPLTIQPKLTIGRPDDPYEQEADHVAERVMRMPEPAVQGMAGCGAGNGLSCSDEGTTGNGLVQRRVTSQPGPVFDVPPVVHEVLRSSGQPLESSAQEYMSSRMGHDFSSVRVHTDTLAHDSARAVHASAYTTGNDIVFAPGVYAPSTPDGRHILAHELSHVVQQGGNRMSIQRWGDDIHKEITRNIVTDELNKNKEVVIPIAEEVSDFVNKLLPYSFSIDYKGRRIMGSGPLFLSGLTKGEGPDHGESSNYSSYEIGAAQTQNQNRQDQYVKESVEYYKRVAQSGKASKGNDMTGGRIDRSNAADMLALPGPTGAISGAVAGTMYGVGLGQMTARKVGGVGGKILGALVGLITAPLGLAVGAVAGALGIGGLVSAIKSRPAGDAMHGIFAALGDACHVAQDRGSHWEGVKGRGHDDKRCAGGKWNPDKPENNNDTVNENELKGEPIFGNYLFGGYKHAEKHTRKAISDWVSSIRALGRE